MALYSGLIVEGDAISRSLLLKLDALRSAASIDVDLIAFCQYTNIDDPAIQVVANVLELARQPGFYEADLHIFEFGIHYALFNAIQILPRSRVAVVYHNVTPMELVTTEHDRRQIEMSLHQKHMLSDVAHVLCDSDFNREDVLSFGLSEDCLSILALPPSISCTQTIRRGSRAGTHIQLLYVGRFVRSKGILDILNAIIDLIDGGVEEFTFRLIGRLDHSDSQIVKSITDAASDAKIGGHLELTPNVTTEDLIRAYQTADIFVMPSYHEGYCVPIIEAFSAGCAVMSYDNSNLPYVTGGLAKLITTGDRNALACSLRVGIERLQHARSAGSPYLISTSSGDIAESEWLSQVARRVERLSDIYESQFVHLVTGLLETKAS